MFKLVVLSVVLAVVAAAPGLIGGYHGGYALPAATSYTSRVDVHSKPVITAYAAPIVEKAVIASPVSYAYPSVGHVGYAAPLVTDYSLGHDYGLGHGYGIGGHGYGYGHGW